MLPLSTYSPLIASNRLYKWFLLSFQRTNLSNKSRGRWLLHLGFDFIYVFIRVNISVRGFCIESSLRKEVSDLCLDYDCC